jgi:hypothetical protein
MEHRFETGSQVAQDGRMNAASVGDPCSVVRKTLEELAPCETGFPGVSSCKSCGGGLWCAEMLERALTQRIPSIDWVPAIREVLGLW